MRILVTLLTLGGLVFNIGCQAQSPGTGAPSEIATSLSTTQSVLPTQGDATQMTPSLTTPADSGLQALIEKTKEDLAHRLSISVNQIGLVEANAVVWPDAGMGRSVQGGEQSSNARETAQPCGPTTLAPGASAGVTYIKGKLTAKPSRASTKLFQ